MGKLLGLFGGLLTYLCIGTVVATAGGLVYLRATGTLDNARLERIVTVARGGDLPLTTKPVAAPKDDDEDQPSFDEQQQRRDLFARNLELREQAIKSQLNNMNMIRNEVEKANNVYNKLEENFKKTLDQEHDAALRQGITNMRELLETVDPELAKKLILEMMDNGETENVVAIWTAMTKKRRGDIASEFKTPDEIKRLDSVLQKIRNGEPDTNIIDDARKKLSQ